MADIDLKKVENTTFEAEDDSNLIYRKISSLKARYRDLGMFWGLPVSKLEDIAGKYPSNNASALQEVISTWIKQEHNVLKFGYPSWRKVVEAVADPAGGGNCLLAKDIADQHPGTPEVNQVKNTCTIAVSQVQSQSSGATPGPEPQTDVIDLDRLINDLSDVAPKWSNFGVYLKIKYATLKGIQGEDSKVERCFGEVLDAWLTANEDNPNAVEQIVKALRMPGVDQGRLAKDIEQNPAEVELNFLYLVDRLNCCKANWFHLGIGLGIKDQELKKFEGDQKAKVNDCFREMLVTWLNSEHVSVDVLEKALIKVGHAVLARKIKKDYTGKSFVSPENI